MKKGLDENVQLCFLLSTRASDNLTN